MIELDNSFIAAAIGVGGALGAYVKARYDTRKDREAIRGLQEREAACIVKLEDLRREHADIALDNRQLRAEVDRVSGSLAVVLKLVDRRVK